MTTTPHIGQRCEVPTRAPFAVGRCENITLACKGVWTRFFCDGLPNDVRCCTPSFVGEPCYPVGRQQSELLGYCDTTCDSATQTAIAGSSTYCRVDTDVSAAASCCIQTALWAPPTDAPTDAPT
eukprot:CAMPEP_0198346020 /NCGR_PEP_ID=MMETSP1450-20131203/77282_1 /TAXON_ID=753684 ORGANISM="Madagascaria erythrocladiodes, Strain CCMP3234" /NCGR_SAMPLE_ID=MMETSP1450 /ASSEMBLY_ACC=CAM_ASM_001115 /LENGTH=123 /DNA_ID=CAMNT_0044051411 /DNA_START=102 /DNA_END=469 /DNA_ORIENTATION=-